MTSKFVYPAHKRTQPRIMAHTQERRTTLALFIGYATYSATRKVLSTCTPAMRGDLGFSMVEIGYISSSFSIAYGFSKFFGGIVSDLMSCRLLFSLGLILAGCSNILFGASSSLASLISLWFTNGTVQGLGWPSLAKIVMINLPKETMGSVWSLLTTAGNLGYMLSPFVFLQLIHIASWRATFVCSGLTAVVCGVAAYLALPQSKSVSPRPETTNGSGTSWTSSMRANIVFNVPFWLLLLADACAYFTLKGFVDWALLYLVERKSASEVEATHLLFWSEVGGIVGTFAAGFMSDMVHKYSGKNSRNITSLVFITLSAVTCAMMLYIDPKAAYYEALLCHFFIGFFVNGPKIMCGIAVREVMPPQVSGTAAGILGLVGQIGASAAGAPLARLLETQGVDMLPSVLATSSLCSAALLILPSFLDLRRHTKSD